jgi:protein involved in polysaccharide export with SLBB domain
MIQLKKTAVVLAVMICGICMMGAGAQGPDDPRPRPRDRVPQERSARPATGPRSQTAPKEPSPPAGPAPTDAPRPFAAPPGLSEEAIRSFTEFPPGEMEENTEALVPKEANPFEESPASPPMARPTSSQSSRSTPARIQRRPECVVEPPDLILVEVLEALPGRPISGERLVRPDGRISLGFYGEIPVAGLTLPEIKEKIVLHLRKFVDDKTLGLIESDPKTGEVKKDRDGRIRIKDPKETDRVFVDVTAYNSQNDYVLGEVLLPGRLPYTGGDTVLDLVQDAGGLLPTADKGRIRLIRSFPQGSPTQVLPVDYEEIAMGTDSSTNYAILPNDRLVVPRVRSSRPEGEEDRGASTGEPPMPDTRTTMTPARRTGPRTQGSPYFNRRSRFPVQSPDTGLEQRIDALERKLDRLIEVVERNQPTSAGEPGEVSGVVPGIRDPLQDIGARPAAAGRMESPLGRPREAGAMRPGPQAPGPRRVEPVGPRPANAVVPRRDEPRRDPRRPSRRLSIPEVPEGDRSPVKDLLPEPAPE